MTSSSDIDKCYDKNKVKQETVIKKEQVTRAETGWTAFTNIITM